MRRVNEQELRERQMGVMDVFHNFCVKHNLRYSLAWGNLIGAIRHNGYIPWDDDIDVIMPREDYNYFITHFKDETFGLKSPYNDKDFYLPYSALYDRRTLKKEAVFVDPRFKIGIDIDIFVLDYAENEKQVQKIRKKINKYILFRRIAAWPMEYRTNIIRKVGCRLFKNKANKYCRKIDKAWSKHLDKPHNLMFYASMFSKKYQIYPKDIFDELELRKYEDREYYIMKQYDLFLKKVFGDYMTPPPQSEQTTHHELLEAYILEDGEMID